MFRMITSSLKRARDLFTSVTAFARDVAVVLDPILKTHLEEGETIGGFESVQLAVVRWIDDDCRQLRKLEVVHRGALRKAKKLRNRRDRQQKVLYSKLLQIRKTFEDAFGQGTAPTYLGLEPRLIDVEIEVLRRHAEETIGILSREDFETPEPLVKGIWENPAEYAEQIRDSFKPFKKTLDEIESQKREIERVQVRKTDLLAEVESRLTWSTRFFEAVYHLAGKSSHAERLRRKVGSRASPEETEPEETKPDEAAETESDGKPKADSQAEDDAAVESTAPS